MAGLREQWRREAMRSIQERALDLFDERGFDAVTIERIATAAGVSASSIYRYFGTKEGLLVADEFDIMSPDEIESILDPADPVGSLIQAVYRYESTPTAVDVGNTASPWRRVRYFFTEQSVRVAAFASLDRAAQRIAPLLASEGTLNHTQAQVAANAIAYGYFAALESWHRDGGSAPISGYVEDGLEPLRRIWSIDPPSSPVL